MDDNQLWKLAKARVEFKAQLRKYLYVNVLIWVIWLLVNISQQGSNWGFPWPIYVTLAWGVVLILQYYKVYLQHIDDSVEKEFEKLKRKKDDSTKIDDDSSNRK